MSSTMGINNPYLKDLAKHKFEPHMRAISSLVGTSPSEEEDIQLGGQKISYHA